MVLVPGVCDEFISTLWYVSIQDHVRGYRQQIFVLVYHAPLFYSTVFLFGLLLYFICLDIFNMNCIITPTLLEPRKV